MPKRKNHLYSKLSYVFKDGYRCCICEKLYNSKYATLLHMRVTHQEINVSDNSSRCTHCGVVFEDSRESFRYFRHVKNCNGKKKFLFSIF